MATTTPAIRYPARNGKTYFTATRLPHRARAALEARAAAQKTTVSQILREAVIAHLGLQEEDVQTE